MILNSIKFTFKKCCTAKFPLRQNNVLKTFKHFLFLRKKMFLSYYLYIKIYIIYYSKFIFKVFEHLQFYYLFSLVIFFFTIITLHYLDIFAMCFVNNIVFVVKRSQYIYIRRLASICKDRRLQANMFNLIIYYFIENILCVCVCVPFFNKSQTGLSVDNLCLCLSNIYSRNFFFSEV